MCFSPQADLAGGLVICAIGVDAVRHVSRRRDFLMLAGIPLLLGVHQFIEALVWWWLEGDVPGGIGRAALWAYLLIAFVVLPVFIPVAVIMLEPTRRRKTARTSPAAPAASPRLRTRRDRDWPRPTRSAADVLRIAHVLLAPG